MKRLFILALITLISSIMSQSKFSTSYTYKCPDKKVKIGEDVCMIQSSQEGTTTSPYVVNIKKKSCGKNKKCKQKTSNYNKDVTLSNKYDDIYTCQKTLKLLKIKKKCNYNAECNTGFCSNGKCAAYGSETCTKDENCGPGKYCDFSLTTAAKCTDYVNENEDCDSASKQCAPGLVCNYLSSSDHKCKKLYSIATGQKAADKSLCQSNFIGSNSKCADITKVDTDCSVEYNDGSNGKLDASTDYTLYTSSTDGKKCLYSTKRQELLSDIKKRYDKIKLDKVLEKENCDYETYYCDKKYGELIEVYNNYETLLNQQLIKDDGKKNGDKKCEYEYWRSVTVSSSYVSACLGLAFALLGLLF